MAAYSAFSCTHISVWIKATANARATSCAHAQKFTSSSHSSHRHVSHWLGQIPDANFNSEGPWKTVVLRTGALPTLRMKQVEQDSLGTRPQGIIIADCKIQLERDVCLIHNLECLSLPMQLEVNCSDRMGPTFWAHEPWAPQRTCCHGYEIPKAAPHRAVSGTAFRKAMQAASGKGSWSSLMIYCLRPLCRGRSRPREKSCQVALAQGASSLNCSGGCICVAWGKSSAPGNYSSASKPKATHLDNTPLCNLGDREAVPVASQAGWHSRGRISSSSQGKSMMVPTLCLMCFGLLYVQREALKSAGNQCLAFF